MIPTSGCRGIASRYRANASRHHANAGLFQYERSMRWVLRTETIVLGLCVALVAIAGLAPIAVMGFESVWHDGHFSLDHYRELISSAHFWPLFGNSIQLALATTTVCGLIGVPIGILFAKSDLSMRSGLMWLLTVPFVLPPYFIALGWSRVIARLGA